MTEFIRKRITTKTRLTVELGDANGAIDLSNWQSVTMKMVRVGEREVDVSDAVIYSPCEIDADQGAHKGWVSYKFSSVLPEAGNYDVEFIGVDPDGEVQTFPTRERGNEYIRVTVEANL